jgi:predicted nucleic acid-binding protein
MLVEYGLESGELTGDQVSEVMALLARHRSVSANDLFALVLARVQKATLLTGDRHLTEGGLHGRCRADSTRQLKIIA